MAQFIHRTTGVIWPDLPQVRNNPSFVAYHPEDAEKKPAVKKPSKTKTAKTAIPEDKTLAELLGD